VAKTFGDVNVVGGLVNKRIIIIDDEPDMVTIARELLEAEGFVVSYELMALPGLKKVRANPPDLVVLDIRLPDMNGFDVCREIKSDPKTCHVPVVMVSVKSDEADVVVGLELGADDYVTKPYRKQEFIARIKRVLKRWDSSVVEKRVSLGPLKVDFSSHIVTLQKKPVALTPKEFELLAFFLKKQCRVLTRAAISESVWGVEFTGSTRTIDVHVDQLRRKLGRAGEWIQSLKGIGYRFEPDV